MHVYAITQTVNYDYSGRRILGLFKELPTKEQFAKCLIGSGINKDKALEDYILWLKTDYEDKHSDDSLVYNDRDYGRTIFMEKKEVL